MRIPINNSILIFKEHTIKKKNTPWCDIISKPMTTEHYFCCNNHQLLQFKPCQSPAVQLVTTYTGGHITNGRLFWAISEISTSSACGRHRLFPLDSAFFLLHTPFWVVVLIYIKKHHSSVLQIKSHSPPGKKKVLAENWSKNNGQKQKFSRILQVAARKSSEWI